MVVSDVSIIVRAQNASLSDGILTGLIFAPSFFNFAMLARTCFSTSVSVNLKKKSSSIPIVRFLIFPSIFFDNLVPAKSKQVGSLRSLPLIASKIIAESLTVRVIGPM